VRAATKELIPDGQLANRDMKPAPPHYEEGLLTTAPKYFYFECCLFNDAKDNFTLYAIQNTITITLIIMPSFSA
jgi:hypothetical protein